VIEFKRNDREIERLFTGRVKPAMKEKDPVNGNVLSLTGKTPVAACYLAKEDIPVKSSCCLLLVLVALMLIAPKPVSSAEETPGPTGEEVVTVAQAPVTGAIIGGQGEGFEPEAEAARGETIPATFGPLVTDTAIPIKKGQFVIQPIFGSSFVNRVFNQNWERVSARGKFRSFVMDWNLTYGLIDNMEVIVDIPYVHNWARNVAKPGPHGETSANSGGLSDLDLALKYRLVQETEAIPTVTALFATYFPTGKFRGLDPSALNTDITGGGAYVFTSGLNVSKYLNPVIVYGNLWCSMPTSFTDDAGRQYRGDFVTVNLAAEYPITKKWVALLELTSIWGIDRLFGPETTLPQQSEVSVIPGIEYMATDKFSLAVGLNIDLVGKNIGAALVPMLSMIYAF